VASRRSGATTAPVSLPAEFKSVVECAGSKKRFPGIRTLENENSVPAIDLNVSPNWEFNFGAGIGMTANTDHLILKMIIGRRFTFGGRRPPATDSSPD